MIIDEFEPSIEEKTATIRAETRQSYFASMTTPGHMYQNEWKPTWKCSSGKCYLNRRIHQTFLHPIITCYDRCLMAWQSMNFILTKMQKMGWLVVSFKRRVVFPRWNSNAARKMVNIVANDGQYFQWHVTY